ncbi:hypothetical protein VC83_07366 [Pseudogymnoascus destructans]|uniref:CRAL-TRIO domain-containing protein n=2 Tax=Pseudogymnoascus destructans TaxID=655981 RepID=L8GAW3_PSED2|nr:uncharacterized protein VC83_07366 [Pseudogymnoascus destructans]ELR10029.1 hypothetical protein GMDG_04434 [Pseudogymnoascus destructans 20631-21]OAF56187.1 hypothetical protein VC83_07366 [Pseudogymnoascus destructans]
MATVEKGSGFVGYLSVDQEVKLQQLWTIILKASDTHESLIVSSANGADSQDPVQHQHGKHSSLSSNPSGETRILSQEVPFGKASCLLRMDFLNTIRHDHPDAFLLRFLRARKWDVIKAFNMMMGVIEWRTKVMNVDQLMAEGELQALQLSQSTSNGSKEKNGHDFLAQVRMGKSFIHGVDRVGRPICVVRVRLHRPGEQSEETMERYIVHFIESVRLMMVDPAEMAAVVFDMTGFSLSNMEYPPVKFIIKCLETNYPESLGVLLIHKAPWVFSGIWRLIKGWLDPVIASKIYFTNNAADLEKFISREQIVQELGGDNNWAYKYFEPTPNENDKMKDTATRDVLLTERQRLGDSLLLATSAWIAATTSKDEAEIAACKDQRSDFIERLRSNYWQLDPYLRARTVLDRTGAFKDLHYHPSEESLVKIRGAQTKEMAKIVEVEHLETMMETYAVKN